MSRSGSSKTPGDDRNRDGDDDPAELRRLLSQSSRQDQLGAGSARRRDPESAVAGSFVHGDGLLEESPKPDRERRQVRPVHGKAIPFVDLSSPGTTGRTRIVMALAFLVMPLVAGIITLISLIPQFSTRNWIAVPAVITASRIDTMDTRDSSNRPITAHKLVLEYSYQLEGRTSIGTRVDAVNFGNRPLSYMEARLLEYPLGTTTTAYYNPNNSKQSVLKNRLLAIHAPLLIPVIPLIPWAFKFASDGLGIVKVRLFQSRHGGVRTWDDGSRTTIRLPRPGAFVFTVYVWFGLMLAVSLYFLLANMFALFDHSLWSAMNLYAATLPLAVIAGIIKRFVIRSGLEDISINHETREVLLPSTFGRPTGSAVHIDHIVAVQTSDVMRLLRGFGKRRMATQLTLITQTHKHILVIWPDARRADALGRYLAQVLNQVKSLPPHPGSEAPTPRR